MSEVSKLECEGFGCCAGLIDTQVTAKCVLPELVYKRKKMGMRTMILIMFHVQKLINICLWMKGFPLYDVHAAVI